MNDYNITRTNVFLCCTYSRPEFILQLRGKLPPTHDLMVVIYYVLPTLHKLLKRNYKQLTSVLKSTFFIVWRCCISERCRGEAYGLYFVKYLGLQVHTFLSISKKNSRYTVTQHPSMNSTRL